MNGLRMGLVVRAWGLSLAALALSFQAAAAAPPAMLDLSGFDPRDDETAIRAGYDTVVPFDDHGSVSLLPETTRVAQFVPPPAARRCYVTGIVGGSFLVFSPDTSPSSCVTGGGATGLALERSNGRIRVEAEGRYRGPIEQTYLGFNENFSPRDPNPVGIVQARNLGGWSVLANVWRDFRLSDRFELYGGGGIGAAGFEASFQQIDVKDPAPATLRRETGYAWQIGVGGIWNVSERIAFDASYRIFGSGWTVTREAAVAGFPRNEILLSLRIYEPFRGMLR